MKAMIFAAGLGTRLRPITDTIPKALVPIAGKPLLEHVVTKLADNGFDEIVVNVHHHADKIISFLNEKKNFGIHIDISDERELLLETGGGIRHAAKFFNDGAPFLVHNVDILSNANLKEIYDFHMRNENIATLLVNRRNTSRYLLFDDTKRLCGWTNVKTGEIKSPIIDFKPENYDRYAFSGIQVLSPSVFRHMDGFPPKFPIMDFYLKKANEIRIGAYFDENLQMIDVGKLGSMHEAEELYKPKPVE
mgnify:CR=1 FL=1